MSDTISVLTEQEVLDYLGIDYADTMVKNNIARVINTADAYLKGSIGNNYPKTDPRAKELALIIVSDLYDTRGFISDSVSNNVRRLVDDLSLQLRLELGDSGESEENTDTISFKPPYISDSGNWFVWDEKTQSFIDTNVSAKGHTPQKGIDYFTEKDKNDLVTEITTELKEVIQSAILDSWEVPV